MLPLRVALVPYVVASSHAAFVQSHPGTGPGGEGDDGAVRVVGEERDACASLLASDSEHTALQRFTRETEAALREFAKLKNGALAASESYYENNPAAEDEEVLAQLQSSRRAALEELVQQTAECEGEEVVAEEMLMGMLGNTNAAAQKLLEEALPPAPPANATGGFRIREKMSPQRATFLSAKLALHRSNARVAEAGRGQQPIFWWQFDSEETKRELSRKLSYLYEPVIQKIKSTVMSAATTSVRLPFETVSGAGRILQDTSRILLAAWTEKGAAAVSGPKARNHGGPQGLPWIVDVKPKGEGSTRLPWIVDVEGVVRSSNLVVKHYHDYEPQVSPRSLAAQAKLLLVSCEKLLADLHERILLPLTRHETNMATQKEGETEVLFGVVGNQFFKSLRGVLRHLLAMEAGRLEIIRQFHKDGLAQGRQIPQQLQGQIANEDWKQVVTKNWKPKEEGSRVMHERPATRTPHPEMRNFLLVSMATSRSLFGHMMPPISALLAVSAEADSKGQEIGQSVFYGVLDPYPRKTREEVAGIFGNMIAGDPDWEGGIAAAPDDLSSLDSRWLARASEDVLFAMRNAGEEGSGVRRETIDEIFRSIADARRTEKEEEPESQRVPRSDSKNPRTRSDSASASDVHKRPA